MSPTLGRVISVVCVVLGLLSIGVSIGIWAFMRGEDPAHAERFGIFVGLWAPTFIALSTRMLVCRHTCCGGSGSVSGTTGQQGVQP